MTFPYPAMYPSPQVHSPLFLQWPHITEIIGSLGLFTSYHHRLRVWHQWICVCVCVCVCVRVRPRWLTEVWRTTTRCSSRLSPSLRPPVAHHSPSPSSPPLRSCTSPQSDPAPHPSPPPSLSLTLIRQVQVSIRLHLLQVGFNPSSYCSTWLRFRFFKNLLSFEKVWLCQRREKFSFCFVLTEGAGWQGQWGAAVPNTNLIREGRVDGGEDGLCRWLAASLVEYDFLFFFVSLFLPCSSRADQTVMLLCSRRFDPVDADLWARHRLPVGLTGWNPLEPLWSI